MGSGGTYCRVGPWHGFRKTGFDCSSYSESLAFLTPHRSSAREDQVGAPRLPRLGYFSAEKSVDSSSGETSLQSAVFVLPQRRKIVSSTERLSDTLDWPSHASDRRNASCHSSIVMGTQDWGAQVAHHSDCVVMHHLSPA